MNTTITSLHAVITGIPERTKGTMATNSVYTAGNVGIGTASPGTTLEVASSANNFFTLTRTNKTTGSGEFKINVEKNSQATFSYDATNSIVFGTSSNPVSQTGFSERMRITSSGNVGIGTNAPTLLLSVNGNADKMMEQPGLYSLICD